MIGNQPSARITSHRIQPQSGFAFMLTQRQILRLIDTEGEQVADLVCFAKQDLDEYLSTSRTIGYGLKLFLSTNDVLYSNWGNPMLTILEDRVGKHDILFAPCSQQLFELVYGVTEAHPNCLDNLSANLAQYHVKKAQIPPPFNVFMNADIFPNGKIEIMSPLSKAGDYIDLQAEMDLIVGISTCSSPRSNNNHFTPIDVEIYEG